MKGTDTGWVLTAGLAGLAAMGLFMPRKAAKAYGAPMGKFMDGENKTLSRAVEMRDLGLAATLGAALSTDPRLAVVPAATIAAVSAGDLLNVVASGRPRTVPTLLHLAGITLGVLTATQIAKNNV